LSNPIENQRGQTLLILCKTISQHKVLRYRYTKRGIQMSEEPVIYISNQQQLDQLITSLSIHLYTADAPEAQTNAKVYCNVVFNDGSLLFAPRNFELDTVDHNDRERDQTDIYELPVPAGLDKTIGDIAEIYLRKAGTNGWLLGSALLFANGISLPAIGNSQVNQFLDSNQEHTLNIADWSTRSLCSSFPTPADSPLLCPGYQICGPVLGHISDTGANVLYRVDREGNYQLKVIDVSSGLLVFDQTATMSPTAKFEIRCLQANRHYTFRFFHILNGNDIEIMDGSGGFRTFPADGTRVKFSFAFGSCVHNEFDVNQYSWNGIRNLAADPSIDPIKNPSNDIRFFLHLGDTFYYYDDVSLKKEPENLRTVLAANLSSRKHPGFLNVARILPSCAVWDDHDFRINDSDSTDYLAIDDSLEGFLNYWGNDPISPEFGLTTLLSYGNVDIYLLDGRIKRDHKSEIYFSQVMLDKLKEMIFRRGRGEDRLVILASGSTWNHEITTNDAYGHDSYETERENLYSSLNDQMGQFITGLAFLSGDIHLNQIHEIILSRKDTKDMQAPEFICSPLSLNSKVKQTTTLDGERVWNANNKGFATLDIDTTSRDPARWTVQANYFDQDEITTTPYATRLYTLKPADNVDESNNRKYQFESS